MISWTGANKPIKKVGLIGCGRMGRCMLEGMLAKGYSVVVYEMCIRDRTGTLAQGGAGGNHVVHQQHPPVCCAKGVPSRSCA